MAEPVLKKGSERPRGTRPAGGAQGSGLRSRTGRRCLRAKTESAVKKFQQAREIAADGVVGRVTWINIDEADQSHPVLKAGSTGLPVRRLQSRMSAVGFDTGGVDGRFGAKTEAAVKKLQQDFNLSVDGLSDRRLGKSSMPWKTKVA